MKACLCLLRLCLSARGKLKARLLSQIFQDGGFFLPVNNCNQLTFDARLELEFQSLSICGNIVV